MHKGAPAARHRLWRLLVALLLVPLVLLLLPLRRLPNLVTVIVCCKLLHKVLINLGCLRIIALQADNKQAGGAGSERTGQQAEGLMSTSAGWQQRGG
jgi:hypothetical protein